MAGSWRLAARLARRETRRRPLRALLVVLLIAVPVFALTVADVLIETGYTRSDAESFRRAYGPSGIVFLVDGPANPGFSQALPTGSTVVTYSAAELPLTPARGQGLRPVRVLSVGGRGHLAFAGLQLREGRPAKPGEVMLSRGVADWLGVQVGDRVRFDRPRFSGRVVGIVRSTEDFRTPVLVAPSFDFGAVRQPGLVQTSVVVALPTGFAAARSMGGTRSSFLMEGPRGTTPFPALVARAPARTPINSQGAALPEQYDQRRDVNAEARFWGWVAVALLLAAIGVIISAAFATTARRQLVSLGLLAANGADPRFLRRTLTWQGTLLGSVGAVIGVGAGLVGLFLARDWIESLFHRELSYVISLDLLFIALTAIVAATIAARFPARSTSQVPVLSALGGRRPLAPVPRLRWLKAVTVFGTGLALLALVAIASRDKTSQPRLAAVVAILGGLLVMAGAAYLAPVVVELLVKSVARLGASARISARGLVRVRTRSAAVVTAGAISGALAIAMVTAVLGLSTNWDLRGYPGLPTNVVAITGTRSIGGLSLPPTPADLANLQDVANGVVPGVKFANIEGFVAAPVGTKDVGPPTVPVFVDSPQLRKLVVLPAAARRALNRDGAVWDAGSFQSTIANRTRIGEPSGAFRVGSAGGPTFNAVARPVGGRTYLGSETFLIVTPRRVRSLSVTPTVVGSVGVTPRPIDGARRDALYRQFDGDPYRAQSGAQTNPSTASFAVGSGATIPAFWRGVWNPARLQLGIAGVASLFVMLVVGVGLLLGAAEGSDERAVLEALGAKPKSRRRMTATSAYLLAVGGAVLALPTGFIPIAVVFQAIQKPSSDAVRLATGSSFYPEVAFPWVAAIAVLVVIPLIAALGAWVASAVGQRAHAFRGTLAFDAD